MDFEQYNNRAARNTGADHINQMMDKKQNFVINLQRKNRDEQKTFEFNPIDDIFELGGPKDISPD